MPRPSKKPNQEKVSPSQTVGVGGYRKAGGYVWDEYNPDLRGKRGRQKYREMSDNDPIIGAMLFAIKMLIRSAKWTFKPSDADADGKYAKWMEDTCFNMPGITWDQVIEDALSMLPYGFAIQEMVTLKKADGTIGLAKLAPRSQQTILRWELDKNGECFGAWQTPPEGGFDIFLPLEKIILYKTEYANGNPEGRSVLRNCYQPYHFTQSINISEAIGVERDLTGLPILRAPGDWLKVAGNRAFAERIVRDVRMNDQSGIVLDSDTFPDGNGGASAEKKFDFALLSSEGNAKVDTDKIVKRHSSNIARTLLADFIILGTDGKGSYALSTDKSSMFVRALEGFVGNIGETLDRKLTSTLWMLNAFPDEMKPKACPGDLSPVDLQVFGDFISKIAGAGVYLNDEETEEYIRAKGNLPGVPADRPDPIADPEEDNGEGEDDNPDPEDGANAGDTGNKDDKKKDEEEDARE